MYTIQKTDFGNLIVRDEDGAFIPEDPRNKDYQDYLKWKEGSPLDSTE